MIEIKGTTKVCALIGEPVEHSASPEMHNAAFRKLGLDYVYVAFRVKREDLPRAVAGLRALNVKGFNVTIPHKVEVVSLLDKVDPLAEKIGAVNTVVNEDGRLTGYNTDAEGFLKALTAREVTLEGKTVVILGAGGAARAIGYILAERGTRLIILNRHPEKARELATIIGKGTGAGIEAGSLEPRSLEDALKRASILVNATSAGMVPRAEESPVPVGLLHRRLTVFDTVYNPLETRLLRDARGAGCKVISGLEMLVHQGASAFTKWTGKNAPVGLMHRKALEVLKKR